MLQIKVHALTGAMDRFARLQPHLHIMRLEAQVYEVLGPLAPESDKPLTASASRPMRTFFRWPAPDLRIGEII
jgi:hypothetical protein